MIATKTIYLYTADHLISGPFTMPAEAQEMHRACGIQPAPTPHDPVIPEFPPGTKIRKYRHKGATHYVNGRSYPLYEEIL